MNPPYDVRLEDVNNMSLYTLAMVFYMHELTPTHDPVAIRDMFGGIPPHKVSDLRLQTFLLDQGFILHHVCESIPSGYSGRWSQDVRSPEFSDVANLVASNHLVLSTHSAGFEWLRLSWAMDTAENVRIFEPRQVNDYTSSVSAWEDEDDMGFVAWAVSEGLLAISRP